METKGNVTVKYSEDMECYVYFIDGVYYDEKYRTEKEAETAGFAKVKELRRYKKQG